MNIRIIAQAFYGNRTRTEINRKDVDRFILGYLDESVNMTEKVDKTIISVPNTDNIVIVYNKYQEEECLNRKNNGHKAKPLAVIPENNIKIYSRCIACRINEDGELESLQSGDFGKVKKYLAE